MSLFSGAPSYTPPPVSTVASGPTDEELAAQEAAKAAEKARIKARKGFASTILGGTASTTADTQKKTLLGS